jgi:hypothetical protein
MSNLLTKCNADVFKAILDIKEKNPSFGERIISILQNHESHFDLTCGDMLWFSAHLPHHLWNFKIHTFHELFQSQETTVMP